MGNVKFAKYSYIATSAAVFIIGCVFLLSPDTSLYFLCRAIGAVILLSGVAKILGYFSGDLYHIAFQFDLALGALTALLGIAFLIFPGRFAAYLAVLISIFVIINAFFTMQNAIEAKKFGIRRWWLLLLGGGVACVCATYTLIRPLEITRLLLRLVGIVLMADGLQNIAVALTVVRARQKK